VVSAEFAAGLPPSVGFADISPTRGEIGSACVAVTPPRRGAPTLPLKGRVSVARPPRFPLRLLLPLHIAGILVGADAGVGAEEGFGVVGAGSSGQARG